MLAAGLVGTTPAQAQQIPESVQEELEGMSPAEARRRAEQLGIDLSNPQQALRQARQRGLPEARIRALIEAARQRGVARDSIPALTPQQVSQQGVAPLDTVRTDSLRRVRARRDTVAADTVAADTTRRTRRDTLSYFGYDTFRNVPEAFEPSPTGPVDDTYIVSPGDELRLVVWGAPEFQYDLSVDRQGRIFVPNHGQFTAAGKRLSALRDEMRQWLSRQHQGLTTDPPTVFMDLSVTRIRPVQVFVLGEVPQPGGYTVSAMSTVFNALYSIGGPLQRGSLRRVRIIRNGEVIDTVDLYDYLLEGGRPQPVQLQSNDYIHVPPRGETVAITGAVKRPAYYEMKPDETVRDLIGYAGGLEAEAYMQSATINRVLPPSARDDETASVARTVLDVPLDSVMAGSRTVDLADADRVHIPSILEADDRAAASRVEAAEVSGAVYQPGQYAITDRVRTVRDLLRKAGGLTDDAYRQARLLRIDRDLDDAVRTIHVDSVMAGVPQDNLALLPGDSLHVPSVQSLEGRRTVRISGAVRDPGRYPYRTDMTVGDLLLQGGGLADSVYVSNNVLRGRADLYRTTDGGRSERVIPFHLGRALAGQGMADEPLNPGDEIHIYPLRTEVNQNRFVTISGAVKDSGRYAFRENMTLKDLLVKANGFSEDASLTKIDVARPQRGGRLVDTLRVTLDGGTPFGVSFNVDDTTRALRAAAAFRLQHRDRVFVRTDPNFEAQKIVTVRGAVRFPGEYSLVERGEPLESVIRRAGGVESNGYLGGGRLFRNNRQVVVDFGAVLDGEANVGLQDGDELVIPSRPNTVDVRGNVANEGLILHESGKRVGYYLDRAGGTRDSTKAVYLTQASGATFRVQSGWFGRTPKVDDGAVIRVTREQPKPESEGPDIGNIISDVTGILSSALTVIVLATRALD